MQNILKALKASHRIRNELAARPRFFMVRMDDKWIAGIVTIDEWADVTDCHGQGPSPEDAIADLDVKLGQNG